MMEVQDRLEVKILEAKDISFEGSRPNCFVELQVGPDRRRSTVIPEDSTPHWKSPPFIFNSVLSNNVETILVNLFHRNNFTGVDMDIGKILIPMDTYYNAPRTEFNAWFEIRSTENMIPEDDEIEMKTDLGFLRLAITFFNEPDPEVVMRSFLPDGNTAAPNILKVRVLRGKGIGGARSSVDASVVIQVGETKSETKTIQGTTNPTWNEEISVPIEDSSKFIEITLYHNGLVSRTFLGRVRMSIVEVAAHGDKGIINTPFEILNENLEFDGVDRGTVYMEMKWVYDDETAKMLATQKAAVAKKSMFAGMWPFGKKKSSEEDMTEENKKKLEEDKKGKETKVMRDDDEENDEHLNNALHMTPYELAVYLEEQRQKRKDDIDRYMEAVSNEIFDAKEGDYTVQVHVMECRNLRAKDANGVSDPQVVVEVQLGEKQTKTTRIQRKNLSPFYDETFFFNFKNVTKDQLDSGKLVLRVNDTGGIISIPNIADIALFNELIGSYSVDLMTVYKQNSHEMWRQWGVLYNSVEADDVDQQGQIKFSVSILGSDDSQRMHDASREEEDNEDDEENADIGDVEQRLSFIVCNVMKAEGLPGFKSWTGMGGKGLFCSCIMEFGSNVPARTSKVMVSGDKDLTVQFDEELWMPVWLPCPSQTLKLTIVHSEFATFRTVVLAVAHIDFNSIPKVDGEKFIYDWSGKKYDGPRLKWVHFYGANPEVKVGKRANLMNKNPRQGIAYRGGLLAGLRLLNDVNNTPEYVHTKSINYAIPKAKMPLMGSYFLRVMFFCGNDFEKGRFYRWSASISIGAYKLKTTFKMYSGNGVVWLEVQEQDHIELPFELEQLPDAIITINKGNENTSTTVGYCRMPAAKLLSEGIDSPPRWFTMSHDISKNRLVSGLPNGYPGCVLMKIAFANSDDVTSIEDWDSFRKKMNTTIPVFIRVFVYSCRNLPSIDENGLMDPYVKVRYDGQKNKTRVIEETKHPCFYETITFDATVPADIYLSPNILVEVWDKNGLGQSNIPISSVRLNVADAQMSKSVNDNTGIPKWYELHGIDGNGKFGEILLGYQVITKTDEMKNIPTPPSIIPQCRNAWIDCHLVGIRNLLKIGSFPIHRPYIKLNIYDTRKEEMRRAQTMNIRTPNPTDPNFLDRLILDVTMPEDPLFTPALEITVWDQGISGRAKMLGAYALSLHDKLPWNPSEYRLPRSHQILEDAVKARLETNKRLLRKSAGDDDREDETEDAETDDVNLNKIDKKNDTGYGVFPLLPGKAPMSQYIELPDITDRDELERLKRRHRKNKSSRTGNADDSAKDETSNEKKTEEWKKLAEFPPGWADQSFMKGRHWMCDENRERGINNDTMEGYLKTSAFENYKLYRGHISFNRSGRRKDTMQYVGFLRAVFRVCVTNPKNDTPYNKFFNSLRNTTTVAVRLYVIRAFSLQPKDFGGTSDPYVVASLAGRQIKDIEHVKEKTLDPEIFKRFDFESKLPGPSALKVAIWDKNNYKSDELIGETTIDLEDRWFHPEWIKIDKKKTPIENRPLRLNKGSPVPQGTVQLWLDIMNVAEAQKYKPIDIAGPDKKSVEVRIVCYRAMGIPLVDGDVTDAYMRFWMEGSPRHYDTDIHLRCKDGCPAWNWRIKFNMDLPIKDRAYGRLRLQCWDWDIIGSGDMIGETSVDIYDWLLKAYHTTVGRSVKPFKEKQDILHRLEEKTDHRTKWEILMGNIGLGPSPTPEEDPVDAVTVDEEDSEEEGEMKGEEEVDDSDEEGRGNIKKPIDDNDASQPLIAKTQQELEDEEEKKNLAEKKKRCKKAATRELSLVEKTYEQLGWGTYIHEDAEWIDLYNMNQDTKVREHKGRIAFSIEILTEEDAQMKKVGSGRGSPNEDPTLPYPPGRLNFMSLMMNPCALIYEFFGVGGIVVCCCIICILIGALFATILSGVMSFISAVVMIQESIETNQRVAEEINKNITYTAEHIGINLPTNPPVPSIPGVG